MRVLIVEDEKLLLWSLERSLTKHKLKVSARTNAEEALPCLEKNSFDWIITDYRLPGIDGLEFLQRARLIQPEIKVAVISAYGSPQLLKELQNNGVNLFLSKPFNIDHLLFSLQESLSGTKKDSLSSGSIILNSYMLFI